MSGRDGRQQPATTTESHLPDHGDDVQGGHPPAGTPAQPARSVLVGIVVVLVALAALVGLIVGSRLGSGPSFPGDGSVDAGFARDMSAHHSQAVEMSLLVRDRTQDPEVRSLALDVILTQQQQAGQMFGWLRVWGLPQSSGQPVMGWMQDHASMAAMGASGKEPAMPGMASQEDLNRLAASSGRDAERLYLQLMIPHHEGGVAMARYAAKMAEEEPVRQLAASMVKSQTAELTVLNNLLDARGGPLPE